MTTERLSGRLVLGIRAALALLFGLGLLASEISRLDK